MTPIFRATANNRLEFANTQKENAQDHEHPIQPVVTDLSGRPGELPGARVAQAATRQPHAKSGGNQTS